MSCLYNLVLQPKGYINNCPYGKCVCKEKNKYLADDLACLLCDEHCEECGDEGHCEKCIDGWGNIRKCSQCHQLCKTCVMDSITCLSCQNGAFLQDSHCCLFNCVYCTSTDNCKECKQGYYLEEQIDTISRNICLSCSSMCLTCFGNKISQCLSCSKGYYYHPDSHVCGLSCENGYYLNNNECLKCHESCSTCNGPNPDQCQQCSDSRHLYIPNDNQNFCCDESCIRCTGPDQVDCISSGIQTSNVNISEEYKQFKAKQYKFPDDKKYMMGMAFVTDRYCPNVNFGSEKALLSLKQIRTTGANWAAIVVTEYQYAPTTSRIYPIYDPIEMNYYTHISSTIPSISFIIKQAHKLGMIVMLKPHIDLEKQNLINFLKRKFNGNYLKASRIKRQNIIIIKEKLAIKDALRYFPQNLHNQLGKEFLEELPKYEHISMYRFRLTSYEMKAYPIKQYPTKIKQCATIQAMIMIKLLLNFHMKLFIHGSNSCCVFQNWAQYRLTMKYLNKMSENQTLILTSRHPQGFFPSIPKD